MKQVINWGIIGCGKIAHKFAQDLATISNANLVAVASRNIEKAQKFGETYNVLKYYGTYEGLSEDSDIEVIYIATPHVFHYENTLMCLKNKKAVLCEKPFAMNKGEVEEMIHTAKRNKVFLMEALWTYFLPHYKFVLKIITTKELGQIKSLQADFGFSSPFDPDSRIFNKKLGGGSLLDVGIYPLFAALSLIGYPDQINANAKIGESGVDETCSVNLTYENDITASLYSAITEKTKTEAILELEKGTIIISSRFHEPSSITIIKNGNSKTYNFDVHTNGYNFEAIHVQEMLQQQRTESTIMTFEKSLQLIELLDKVRNLIGLKYD